MHLLLSGFISQITSSNTNMKYIRPLAGPSTPWPHPDSKVRGANVGPIWGRQDQGGPYELCYLGIYSKYYFWHMIAHDCTWTILHKYIEYKWQCITFPMQTYKGNVCVIWIIPNAIVIQSYVVMYHIYHIVGKHSPITLSVHVWHFLNTTSIRLKIRWLAVFVIHIGSFTLRILSYNWTRCWPEAWTNCIENKYTFSCFRHIDLLNDIGFLRHTTLFCYRHGNPCPKLHQE